MKTSHTWVVPNKNVDKQFIINWLYNCRYWYWVKADPDNIRHKLWPHKPSVRMDLLVWLYYYGWRHGYISITFEGFKDIILQEKDPHNFYSPEKKKKKTTSTWYRYLHRHDYSTKYQKKKDVQHGIQNLESVKAKRLWREVSGKQKDHQKQYQCSYRRRNPGRFYKKVRSQQHRAWVKRNLIHGNYEVFHQKERDVFVNSYVWD